MHVYFSQKKNTKVSLSKRFKAKQQKLYYSQKIEPMLAQTAKRKVDFKKLKVSFA